MDRYFWARHIEALDPERDHHEIYRLLSTIEFPWDMTQALSFALYRTYAVPSIGQLLCATGEFTGNTQRRYDDTGLILDTVLEFGLDAEQGRSAVRRMNRMHGSYDISADDMRYVLSTFVVSPIRWLDQYGWRRLSDNERMASAHYYRDLGRHMGISDIPATHQEFATFMDSYEREHFGYDEGGRAVSDATLDLMATFPPNNRLPRPIARRLAIALLDRPLCEAFGYPAPTRVEQAMMSGGLRARARLLQLASPRTSPMYFRARSTVRSYPDGYDVEQLGTFPRQQPAVGRRAPADAS